jgi:hypothetical protein
MAAGKRIRRISLDFLLKQKLCSFSLAWLERILSAFDFRQLRTQTGQAKEPEWQLAKIDFHIPFAFSSLLKPLKLCASTENASCGK